MASASPAQRCSPQPTRSPGAPPPFPDPFAADPSLAGLLAGATELLCRWLAGAADRPPLPGLTPLPPLAPEAGGLPPERLLADLQLLMDGAYHPGHPGALA
ncbi:MAG: aspartate aminotransferase family protein, partial [Prochlorococcaceae cyanobacterium]